MNRPLLDKEERTRLFLEWFDEILREKGWTAERLARLGDFDSSVIVNYRKGRINVGAKVAEKAARGAGYGEAEVLRLLQHLQFVPGGIDESRAGAVEQRALHWSQQLEELEDAAKQEELTAVINAIIQDALNRFKTRGKTSRTQNSNKTASARR